MGHGGQGHDGQAAGHLHGAQGDGRQGGAGRVVERNSEGVACRNAHWQSNRHAHAVDVRVVVGARAATVIGRQQIGRARCGWGVQVLNAVGRDIEVGRIVAGIVLQRQRIVVEAWVAVGQGDLLATVDRLRQREGQACAVGWVNGHAADGDQLAIDGHGKRRRRQAGLHRLAHGQRHLGAVKRNAIHQCGGDPVGGRSGHTGVVHVQRERGGAGFELGIGVREVACQVHGTHHQGVVALHQFRAGVGEEPRTGFDAGFAQGDQRLVGIIQTVKDFHIHHTQGRFVGAGRGDGALQGEQTVGCGGGCACGQAGHSRRRRAIGRDQVGHIGVGCRTCVHLQVVSAPGDGAQGHALVGTDVAHHIDDARGGPNLQVGQCVAHCKVDKLLTQVIGVEDAAHRHIGAIDRVEHGAGVGGTAAYIKLHRVAHTHIGGQVHPEGGCGVCGDAVGGKVTAVIGIEHDQ